MERCKRTTRRLNDLPAVRPVFETLRSPSSAWGWSNALGYPVEDDPTLWGGGLHVTEPSGELGCHLDFDLQPNAPGKRRALNLIVFLHPEWRPGWGGQFYIADPMGRPVVTIDPLPGRLVAMECNDLSYHGVMPVTGPAERVSAAVYMLAEAGPHNTRQRALFLPRRGS